MDNDKKAVINDEEFKRGYLLKIFLTLLMVVPFVMIIASPEWWFKVLWGIGFVVALIIGIAGLVAHIMLENQRKFDFEYDKKKRIEQESIRLHNEQKRVKAQKELKRKNESNELINRVQVYLENEREKEQEELCSYQNQERIKEQEEKAAIKEIFDQFEIRRLRKIDEEIVPLKINGHVLKYKYHNIELAVTSLQNIDYNNLSIKMIVELKHEPDNPYDSEAIVVMTKQGMKLGYLYKNNLQKMVHDFTKKNLPIFSYIDDINENEMKIKICLVFYKGTKIIIDDYSNYNELIESGLEREKFKLTGNKNEEMQDNIWGCSVGDFIDCEFDHDSNKYIVSCSFGEIGYLPKSAEKWIEECDDNFVAFIEDRGIDDNGKGVLTIVIFKKN